MKGTVSLEGIGTMFGYDLQSYRRLGHLMLNVYREFCIEFSEESG